MKILRDFNDETLEAFKTLHPERYAVLMEILSEAAIYKDFDFASVVLPHSRDFGVVSFLSAEDARKHVYMLNTLIF